MPRKPYLPTFSGVNYAVGALLLEDRPELCAAIGKCIVIWGQVDNELGNLFGILLGTDSDAALEVFLSLRRSGGQRDALAAAARYRLTGDEARICNAVLRVYGSLEKERNALAHGCFGVSPDDPSLILWVDVKDHVHFQVEVLSSEARGVVSSDRHERLKKSMYVYRPEDLAALYAQMKEAWRAIFDFNSYLRFPGQFGEPERLARIRELPLIKSALLDAEK